MAKTLTLKNLPEALHARLTAAAKQHRRSLNNEAIVCLEVALPPQPITAAERLEQIRALRHSLPTEAAFTPEEITAFKHQGLLITADRQLLRAFPEVASPLEQAVP